MTGTTERPRWSLHAATADDAHWLADLKAEAMRADLERLGYWDRDWARRRFLEAYVPASTSIIVTGDQVAGCIAVREEAGAWWVEHFYLRAEAQGRGLGGQVLEHVMATRGDGRPFRLVLDRGSRVRALYERHGFVHTGDDANGVDQIFERPAPLSTGGAQRLFEDRPRRAVPASTDVAPALSDSAGGEGEVHRVVVGVLVRGDRALMVHRSPSRRWYPDVWDLPGGHIEKGEDPRAALARELREELGVDADVIGEPIARTTAVDFVADVWAVRQWSGELANLAPDEHDDLAWLSLADLEGRTLAHPDLPEQVRLAVHGGEVANDQPRQPAGRHAHATTGKTRR